MRSSLAFFGAAVLLAACSSPSAVATPSASPTHAPLASQASSATPRSTPAANPLPAEKVVTAIPGAVSTRTASQGYWLTVAGDFVWVANENVGLSRFEPATGTLVGTTALTEDFCQGMESGFASLWVSNCTNPTLLRFSLANGSVQARIAIPSGLEDEASIAVTDSGVWALTKAGTLVHVDPNKNAVIGEIPAPSGAAALRGGLGSLWITSGTGQVSRIDPATGVVTATAQAGLGARFLAVGLGSVWVLNSETATVSRIDPTANPTVATIAVGSAPVDGGDIAIGAGFVWARVSDTLVAQIDPVTNLTVARFGPASGSGSVGASPGVLWISIENQMLLWRVPLS